jgi:long-chain acyl-CoA synthetase
MSQELHARFDIATLAEKVVTQRGDIPMLCFEGEWISHPSIVEKSHRLQSAFQKLGLKPNDIVCVCMENHPLVYSVFLGGFRTGAWVTPVMHQLTASELRYIFAHTECRGIVTNADKLDVVREAINGLDHVQWIAVQGGATDTQAAPPCFSLEELTQHDPASDRPNVKPDDVALMLYTSGTTGKPKGVMLTHSNIIASAETLVDAGELHLRPHPQIVATAMPMAHIYGVALMTYEYAVPNEYPLGYMAQEKWFDAERIMSLIQEHRCTDLAVVPTMMSLILNHPNFDQYDLTSLFKADVGGAPMPIELGKRFSEAVGCHIRQRYGMTENAGKGSTDRISEPHHPGSVGRPYSHTEVIIVDDDDNALPSGKRGEILTRGATTMKGYFRDPEATKETMRNGWLHTGDIGCLSEDGWLYVVDRKKDMIIKGGENIYPCELEEILYQHPDVAEAAVVGQAHDLYGEEPVAYVVPKIGSVPETDSILDHMKQHTTKFKIPREIHLVEELPKSGIGKVLRRALRNGNGA